MDLEFRELIRMAAGSSSILRVAASGTQESPEQKVGTRGRKISPGSVFRRISKYHARLRKQRINEAIELVKEDYGLNVQEADLIKAFPQLVINSQNGEPTREKSGRKPNLHKQVNSSKGTAATSYPHGLKPWMPKFDTVARKVIDLSAGTISESPQRNARDLVSLIQSNLYQGKSKKAGEFEIRLNMLYDSSQYAPIFGIKHGSANKLKSLQKVTHGKSSGYGVLRQYVLRQFPNKGDISNEALAAALYTEADKIEDFIVLGKLKASAKKSKFIDRQSAIELVKIIMPEEGTPEYASLAKKFGLPLSLDDYINRYGAAQSQDSRHKASKAFLPITEVKASMREIHASTLTYMGLNREQLAETKDSELVGMLRQNLFEEAPESLNCIPLTLNRVYGLKGTSMALGVNETRLKKDDTIETVAKDLYLGYELFKQSIIMRLPPEGAIQYEKIALALKVKASDITALVSRGILRKSSVEGHISRDSAISLINSLFPKLGSEEYESLMEDIGLEPFAKEAYLKKAMELKSAHETGASSGSEKAPSSSNPAAEKSGIEMKVAEAASEKVPKPEVRKISAESVAGEKYASSERLRCNGLFPNGSFYIRWGESQVPEDFSQIRVDFISGHPLYYRRDLDNFYLGRACKSVGKVMKEYLAKSGFDEPNVRQRLGAFGISRILFKGTEYAPLDIEQIENLDGNQAKRAGEKSKLLIERYGMYMTENEIKGIVANFDSNQFKNFVDSGKLTFITSLSERKFSSAGVAIHYESRIKMAA
ncbi:hypothetical protein J4212_03340 [Candidatus Woesearchaeota archaeon]|nr:hypothetical protein [Candidatus Woesearchaeota archaeon]